MTKFKIQIMTAGYSTGKVEIEINADSFDSANIFGDAVASIMQPVSDMEDRGNPCGPEPVENAWFVRQVEEKYS